MLEKTDDEHYITMPEIMAALNGKIKSGEKTLTEELEQLFGEDKIPMCRKIMKGNAFVGI
jgi:hypothetical protein